MTELLRINQDTNVYQANREYEAAVRGVQRSTSTYSAIHEEYSITRMRLEDAQKIFIANLEEWVQGKSTLFYYQLRISK